MRRAVAAPDDLPISGGEALARSGLAVDAGVDYVNCEVCLNKIIGVAVP
jgi:hypothetical protein